MGRLIRVEQPYSFDDIIASKGKEYTPDFRVLTAGIESVSDSLVHMVGSSTEKDLQGDTMSLKALNSMTKAAPNMTVWLNHDYTLPDSMFGSIVKTPVIQHSSGIADLHLDVDVELSNVAAAKVKRYIDNGRRLGCSIGCMVTEFEVSENDDIAVWSQPIIIQDVYVVEYSVVGIPANQRSWVENAIRGVFQRTLDPSLASAMKGLWPEHFQKAMKSAPERISAAQMKALQDTPARERGEGRIHWQTDTRSYALLWEGKRKQLSTQELGDFLEHRAPVTITDDLTVSVTEDREMEAVETAMLDEQEDTGTMNTKEQSQEEELSRAINEDGTEGLFLKDTKGNHDKYSGTHTHHHDSFGHGDTATHTHSHYHANGNDHQHDHAHTPMGENADHYYEMEPQKTADTATEEVKQEKPVVALTQEKPVPVNPLLASYNMLGQSLGLPEVTTEMLKAGMSALSRSKALTPEHMMQAQAMHDTLNNMTGGAVCANTASMQDVEVQAAEATGADISQQMNVLESFGTHVASLAKSLETLDGAALRKDMEMARADVKATRTELQVVQAELHKATETIARLKNMPLGNPVGHSRSVSADQQTVTHEEMLGIQESGATLPQGTLAQVFSQTTIHAVEYGSGLQMTVREWPSGVGGDTRSGVRPPLTSSQIQFMDFDEIKAYRSGNAASVPYLDTQVAAK